MTFELSDSERHLVAQSIGCAILRAEVNYANQGITDLVVIKNLLRPMADLREKFTNERGTKMQTYRCTVCGTGPIIVGASCPKCDGEMK